MVFLIDIHDPLEPAPPPKPPRGRHVREAMAELRRALARYRKAAHASKRGAAKRMRTAFDAVLFEVMR